MKTMSRIHRVSINAATNYLRFFITMIVSFILIPFIIRTLGQEVYGLWTLSFSVIGFFSLLDFGFGLGVVKWTGESSVTKEYDHRNHLLSTVFFIYLGIAVFGMLLIAGFSLLYPRLFSIPEEFKKPAVLVLIILAIRSLAIQVPLSLFKGVLFGEQQIYKINIIQVFGNLLYAGTTWVLLSKGYGIVVLALINCSAFFIENLLYVILAFSQVKNLSLSIRKVKKKYFREAVSFSFFSFITTIAGLVLFNTDSIIIQITLNLSMVGLYGVAIKITEYSLILTKQLVNVLTPLISELKAKKEDHSIRYLLTDLSKYLLATGALITGTIYVFGADLLTLWVGESFLPATIPLYILMTAFMISIPELVASNVLTMTGYHRYTAKVSVSSIIVNLTISLLLVKPLGLTGIAIGTLISSVINNTGLTLWKASKVYEFHYSLYLSKVFIPALLPLTALMGTGFIIKYYFSVTSLWVMMLEAVPGVLVYLTIFWLFCVDKPMKHKVMNKLKRKQDSEVDKT